MATAKYEFRNPIYTVIFAFVARLKKFGISAMVFQIVIRSGGIPPAGGYRNFAGGIFLLGGGNLRRSDFDQLNLFTR